MLSQVTLHTHNIHLNLLTYSGRGYSFSTYRPNGAFGECTSSVGPRQELLVFPYINGDFGDFVTTFTVESSSTVFGAHINGYVHVSRDPGPASASTLASTPSRGTTSPQSQPTNAESANALPTGAKVGIGIAVPLAVIGITALLATIFLLRRRTKAVSANVPPEKSPDPAEPSYTRPKAVNDQPYHPQELESTELPGELSEDTGQ